ncbi:hypothetical protein [Pseudoalteromonas sp. BSi20439]|uniref:hypothetical protein n=1 Tax=Pseudoalteromonas sp. BSi20439 TaxID=420915 RepID=UPI000231B7B0|nr:hypothetical protein [Pseudoalteromonas sp. BSi20439]GAA72647.1 hypothetical protein P20439_2741 [Pseudoalteromonas sp. BSi20439]
MSHSTFNINKKLLFAGLIFSIFLIFLGIYLQLHQGSFSYPRPLHTLLSRFPEIRELLDILVKNVFSIVCTIFGAAMLPLVLNMLPSKKSRNLYCQFTNESVTTFNRFTGQNITIPFAEIEDITIKNKELVLTFCDKAQKEHKHYIAIPYLIDGQNFAEQLQRCFLKYQQENNNTKKYTVTYYSNESDNLSIPILAKVLKTNIETIQNRISKGYIELRKNLSSEQARKLVAALNKLKLEVSYKKQESQNFVKDKYIIALNQFYIPTFTSIFIIGFLPGGMVICLVLLNTVFQSAKIDVKAGGGLMTLACLFEVIALSGVNAEGILTSITLTGFLPLLISAKLAFDLKSQLNSKPLSPFQNFLMVFLV